MEQSSSDFCPLNNYLEFNFSGDTQRKSFKYNPTQENPLTWVG